MFEGEWNGDRKKELAHNIKDVMLSGMNLMFDELITRLDNKTDGAGWDDIHEDAILDIVTSIFAAYMDGYVGGATEGAKKYLQEAREKEKQKFKVVVRNDNKKGVE